MSQRLAMGCSIVTYIDKQQIERRSYYIVLRRTNFGDTIQSSLRKSEIRSIVETSELSHYLAGLSLCCQQKRTTDFRWCRPRICYVRTTVCRGAVCIIRSKVYKEKSILYSRNIKYMELRKWEKKIRKKLKKRK